MRSFTLFLIALLAVMGLSSLFVVDQGERGIVIQFGKVKRDAEANVIVYQPGLNFKLPFIDTVKKIDARIQTLDDESDRFVTAEKKDLIVDSYVKWRVKDFATFYLSTNGGNFLQAQALLKQKVNNGLRTEFGTRTIPQIVSGERSDLMEQALKQAASTTADIGIEVLDVRVKQINLPKEVSSSIYDRMRAERAAVAKEHRSQGKEKSEVIRAEVDRKVTVMLANAERESRELRGAGDASAAEIYAAAYSKDTEFFAFLRSLDAYRSSFQSKNDVLVLSPDSEFFKYMKNSSK